jgi:hypothetical protein
MAPSPTIEVTSSRQFPEWLAEQGVSLAFTTYQAGKLFLIELQPDDRLFEQLCLFTKTRYPDWRLIELSPLLQLAIAKQHT